MILFFDTETTGLFSDRIPVDHDGQPYLVQLAAQLCDDNMRPVSTFCAIVDNGVDIPAGAAAVHKITTEMAKRDGLSPELALRIFSHMYQRADKLCAHNIKFDKGVMETAIARHNKKVLPLEKPLVCTMEMASPIVNLPPTDRMRAAGFNKPKPPKLAECIKHFFGEDLPDAHDALVDLAACRRIYAHMQSAKAEAVP